MAADRSQPRSELLKLADEIKRTQQAFNKIGAFDTWTLLVDVSGWLDGSFEDWPSHIQDSLSKAAERDCTPKPGEYVKIIVARCYQDAPDELPYVAVVVQAFPIVVN